MVAGQNGQQLADRHIEMGAVGALHKSYGHAAHSADQMGCEGARPLSLELPQSERIRRGNARSLPKNNYTSGTTFVLGHETGLSVCGAVAPAAGVKVVGDADV